MCRPIEFHILPLSYLPHVNTHTHAWYVSVRRGVANKTWVCNVSMYCYDVFYFNLHRLSISSAIPMTLHFHLALRSLTGQWATRVRHLLLFVATARTLFQSTPWSTKSSLNVDRHVFVGRPRRLPLPRMVHDMAWAGRPGGILIIWPAIRSRLSATMFCNLRCPVRLSTSIFVTRSFHVMPKIFRKFRWWKTSSCWRILAVLFQVSLAYMAVETLNDL